MNRTSLDVVAEMIKESFSGIRKKDVKCIQERDPKELARFVALGLRRSIVEFLPLTPTAVEIGQKVLNGCGEDGAMTERMRNIRAFKIGYHFLHELAKGKAISISKGPKKRDKYMVYIKNVDFIDELFGELNIFEEGVFVAYTEPQFVKPKPFNRFWHPVAGAMVRNTHPDAHENFTMDLTPKVFETINRLMENQYAVNLDLLAVFKASQSDPLFTFEGKTLKPIPKESKIREQDTILEIAEGVGARPFYQYMFYDWRGRLYPSTSYLNHAGHKLAKSLLKFAVSKPIRREGYFFLLVHAANCWAQDGADKLSIDGRHDYTLGKLTEWREIARNPIENKVWQSADSPFEFLAAIMEIEKAHCHEEGMFNYPSGLLVAWDATCSGLQVLAALSRDRHAGELSNIADTELRGDYYKMIADEVWVECVYDEQEEKAFNRMIEDIERMEALIDTSRGEAREEAWQTLLSYTQANGKNMWSLSKVFWGREVLKDKRRKICKRPCMTYFYSCGDETMAESLLEDFTPEPEFRGLNIVFALWLTKRIYRACQELMPKPTELMKLFVQMGVQDYNDGDDFSLNAPITNFFMQQYYREDKVEQVKTYYLGKVIQPVVAIGTNVIRDYNKVLSGSSPNVVHMLDAVIVSSVVLKAEYGVSTVHDSFSALVADSNYLYEDTRQAFVDIYTHDVLQYLLDQKGMENTVEYGDLDIKEAIDNEQCFS